MTEREGFRTAINSLNKLNYLAGSSGKWLNWHLADEVLYFILVLTKPDQTLASNDSSEIEANQGLVQGLHAILIAGTDYIAELVYFALTNKVSHRRAAQHDFRGGYST